eukprot:8772130-Ditylum_brightwellii.AAC.1
MPMMMKTTNDTSELTETLQRQIGRAAVVIIRVKEDGQDDKYLVQLKSRDYPITAFQEAVCLFGGNVKQDDAGPKQTLLRELSEELPESLVDAVIPSLQFIGTTMNSQTAEVVEKPEPYAFMCACYEATISSDEIPSKFKGSEGNYALLTKEQLVMDHTYAWGYDHVMSSYFGEPVKNMCEGVSVTKLSNERLKEWTSS